MAKFVEFVKEAVNTAKKEIFKLANINLTNENKKARLDEVITGFVLNALDKYSFNRFVELFIKKMILPHISEFTQLIFDLLKAKFDGSGK